MKHPNVVYVLADDLGFGDLSCYNPQGKIPTQHCDRLAQEGVRFTDMHSPSAVCTPSRYGILTGRYCWRSRLKKGVLWGYDPNLIEPGRPTVASVLRGQGYRTACIGKWHLGMGAEHPVDHSKPLRPGPLDHGFDTFFGIPASLDMEPYLYVQDDRAVAPPTDHTPGKGRDRAEGGTDGVFWRAGPMAPGFDFDQVLPTLAERAVAYVRDAARRPEPFFLYLPLTGPHTPWLPRPDLRGKARAGDYGDFVVHVDDVLGQVMKALDRTGAANDTLLIFTSDNGADWNPEDRARWGHQANGPWRGQKRDIYEGGHRIPFLARWPGHTRAGAVSNRLGCLTDLLATVAELSGAQLPPEAGEDSQSLGAELLGTRAAGPARDEVVMHSTDGMFALRQGDWKLIAGLGSGGVTQPKRVDPAPGGPWGQLYNLREDPAESKDLFAQRPDVVARLASRLEKIQADGRSVQP